MNPFSPSQKWLCWAALVLLSGCALPSGEFSSYTDGLDNKDSLSAKITAGENVLADRLKQYSDIFASAVVRGADEIVKSTDDPEIARQARLWALRMIPECNTLAHSPNPKVGLLDLAVLATGQVREFEGDTGEHAFGAQADIARHAANRCQDAIWNLIHDVMPEEDARLLREEINRWMASEKSEGFLQFQRMAQLARERNPGEPYRENQGNGFFSDINRNIGGTAYELNRLNRQIELLKLFAQHSPAYARWSAESFLYELSSRSNTLGQNIDRLNTSLETLASASRQLPGAQITLIRDLRDETLLKAEETASRLLNRIFFLGLLLVGLLAASQITVVVFKNRLGRSHMTRQNDERV